MTARLLRLLLRLPHSSAAARAIDHDTSNRALFKYRDAVCVILATYIGARYKLYLSYDPSEKLQDFLANYCHKMKNTLNIYFQQYFGKACKY